MEHRQRRPTLSSDWFSDTHENEEKEKRQIDLNIAKAAMTVLGLLLDKRLARYDEARLTDYESPAWQYKLAHVNGQRQELQEILKLIDPLRN